MRHFAINKKLNACFPYPNTGRRLNRKRLRVSVPPWLMLWKSQLREFRAQFSNRRGTVGAAENGAGDHEPIDARIPRRADCLVMQPAVHFEPLAAGEAFA